MFHKPAHKSTTAGQVSNDTTLADYIERKQNSFDRFPEMKHSTAKPQEIKKKLSFEEWWNEIVFDGNTRGWHYSSMNKETVKLIWKAAQENM